MAGDMNAVHLIGRLTRDVELQTTGGGTAVAELSLAVNRKRKDNATGTWVEVASFFDVKAFGSQADNVAKYLQKGSQVAVAGTLEQQRWEKDGQKRSKVVIIADNVQFLGSKNGGDPNSVPRSPASPVEDDSDSIPF